MNGESISLPSKSPRRSAEEYTKEKIIYPVCQFTGGCTRKPSDNGKFCCKNHSHFGHLVGVQKNDKVLSLVREMLGEN